MIDEESKLRAIWEHTDSSDSLKLTRDDIHVISSYAKVDHDSAHQLMDQHIEKNGGFTPRVTIKINASKADGSSNDNSNVKKFSKNAFIELFLFAMYVCSFSCLALFVYEIITRWEQ